jgi:hypothetical protein
MCRNEVFEAISAAIGLTLVDYYADSRLPATAIASRNSHDFGALFNLVYEGLREVQAIELFNQLSWSDIYTHLLVRRALYENQRVESLVVAAPLSAETEPSLSNMLANIAGVAQSFFDALDSLVRNGVAIERVIAALRTGEVDLPMLVQAARRLNEIDERRPYRIDSAAEIAAKMSG